MKRREFIKWTGISIAALQTLNTNIAKANSRYEGTINILINNKMQYLGEYLPFIDENNRTIVPLRLISELFHCQVEWDSVSKTAKVTRGQQTWYFPVDQSVYYRFDGSPVYMDTQSVIINERLYVPLRYLANELELRVTFDKVGNRPTISLDDKPFVNSRNPSLRDKSVYPFREDTIYTYNNLVNDLNWLKATYGNQIDITSLGKSTSREHELWRIKIGNGSRNAFVVGSLHGNEWLNVPFTVEQVKTYLQSKSIPQDFTIHVIPSANPDGLELVQNGVFAFPQRADELLKLNGGSYDFRYWKANINGVDLNRNFDTGVFEETKQAIRDGRRVGILQPGYAFFPGNKPEDQIETKIIADYIRSIKPEIILDYHSSGRILYWKFNQQGAALARDRAVVRAINAVTGYTISEEAPTVPNTTINRWGVTVLGIPAVTIETTPSTGAVRSVGHMKFMQHYFAERSRILDATVAAIRAL